MAFFSQLSGHTFISFELDDDNNLPEDHFSSNLH